MAAFKIGDVVTDAWRLTVGQRRVYRVLGTSAPGTVRLAAWNHELGIFDGVLFLASAGLRHAPDDWPQTRNVRVWEGEVRRKVQAAADLVLSRIGGAA